MYQDALAIICNLTLSGGVVGGAWEKLNSKSLDTKGRNIGTLKTWKDEMGLEYSYEPYIEGATKKEFVDIRNRHGGVSRVMLMSMNVGSKIKSQIRPFVFSFFYFNELTTATGPEYFYPVIQQLKRRTSVPVEAQQFVADCNPSEEGKDSWVFKAFFKTPHKWIKKKRVGWNKRYAVHHIPAWTNTWAEDKDEYLENVKQEGLHDPTAYARDILGQWVKKQTGDTMFAYYFKEQRHVRGEYGRSTLAPIPNRPIIIGYDPGDKNNSIVFGQYLKMGRKKIWRFFDHLTFIDKQLTTELVVRELMRKMLYWCKFPFGPEKKPYLFPFIHISDNWAINVYREGSYLYMDYNRISERIIKEEDDYKDLTAINMNGAQKGMGSVAARVNLIKEKLAKDEIIISAYCLPIINMFKNLRKGKDKMGKQDETKPLRTAKGEIHVFDALSYAALFMHLQEDEKDVAIEEHEPQEVYSF